MKKPPAAEVPASRIFLRVFALLTLLMIPLLAGCGGPRELLLSEESLKKRPRLYPIDIYEGKVFESHREIAQIETRAWARDNEQTRIRMLDELRERAREHGADAVHDVRILTREISGYTADERTPFPSVRQGDYQMFFLRGVAIRYESGMPGAVARGEGFTADPEGYIPPMPPPSPEPIWERVPRN